MAGGFPSQRGSIVGEVFPFHDVTNEEMLVPALTFYLYHTGNILQKIEIIFKKRGNLLSWSEITRKIDSMQKDMHSQFSEP